ncbi:sn-glycerol-3-phosphate ABC transporter ATP-binding protein UgpC [Martelella sp. AD-3]|uniref:ABC transporter ATP-binding protein n=1 Tax=Martelella sp. AD-3 TaxID=686597 RepID=UPI0004B3B1AC|nr:sn-glycerol-3-phosphate ABC transporter ATP-binding protein UgpC [Martelella sp. AD-3]AMM87262.1 ABC transporter ATP-binding protein [Martelella sp. AD-3]
MEDQITYAAKGIDDACAQTSVSIKDVVIRFGELTVLDRLSLDIGESEFLVLLGPSGCGKSTLLNAIAGLLDVSEGEIWISDRNVTWDEPKDRGIGMVFQSYALYPRMSVEENMGFGLKISGLPKAEVKARVAKAAKILQLEPLLKRKPAELSGGQRQRVAIGRAMVRNVDVFLFDEPLSNLDAKLRAELRVEIKRLHQDLENTMIYVTHDQIEAMTLADRIAVMKGGIIQQLATPQEIYNRPRNLFVAGFIGSPGMNFLSGRLSDKNGALAVTVDGLDIPMQCYESSGTAMHAEQEVVLGVRPEHIALGELPPNAAAEGWFALTGAIEMIEPMGADTMVWSKLGQQPFTARAPADDPHRLGEIARFSIDVQKASLFDAASGERI